MKEIICFVIGSDLFPRPTAVPTLPRTCVDLQLLISAIETPGCCIRSPWTSELGAALVVHLPEISAVLCMQLCRSEV